MAVKQVMTMTTEQVPFGPDSLDTMTLWRPEGPAAGTLFVVHGLTEHIGRYQSLARYMTARGWAVAGFNIPGHGGAFLTVEGKPRPAYCGGEGSWHRMVTMLEQALRRVRAEVPNRPVVLLGFSLGSFVVRAWLAEQKGPLIIDRLVLAGTGEQPAWVLGLVRGVIRRECRRSGDYQTTRRVQDIAFGNYNRQIKKAASPYAWLLTDPGALAVYERDTLVCKKITGGLFRELLSCMIYVRTREKPRPDGLPALFLSGADDPVGERGRGVRRAAAKFPGAQVTLVPGRHDILHDAGQQTVFEILWQWMA